MPDNPSQFIRTEAEALHGLATRLDTDLRQAFDYALAICAARTHAGARIVLTGIGKSGLIARKIAATLNSTGTPAIFLHPAEALHGDLGTLTPADAVLALSYSGETEEIVRLLPAFARLGVPLLSFTGCRTSTLATASTVTLECAVDSEACTLNLAPTASTTVMLALGDALALELARRANFQPQNFADLHPGGPLGRRLARVRDLMHSGDSIPHVAPSAPLPQIIHEMSRKKLGITTVVTSPPAHITDDPSALSLLGIISDGDLRRLLERVGPLAFQRTAADIMNRTPHTIAPTAYATDALTHMEAHKITSLIVLENDLIRGVIHLHDLWQPPAPTSR